MLRTAGVILGLLAMIYIGYQIWRKTTSNVKCEAATPFTYTVKSTGEGYVFREEHVIRSSSSGTVVPAVDTGAKVARGAEVASLYSAVDKEAEQALSEIDGEIALLSMFAEDEGLTAFDVSHLNEETYDALLDIRQRVEQNKYSEALSRKTTFITDVNRLVRASSGGAASASDVAAEIEALKQKRANIAATRLGSLIESFSADASGWYYPESDGYESAFSALSVEGMTYDDFRAVTSSAAEDTSRDVGKIVTSQIWYFACEMSAESLASKEVGSEYTVYFPSNRGEKIKMTLCKICESADGGVAVFKTDVTPQGFVFTRRQSFEILEGEYTGFKIPKSAVRIVDGYMGVYVLSGEMVHFRRIEVMIEYENCYIVVMDHAEPEVEEETEAAKEDDNPEGVAESPEWSSEDETTAAPETEPPAENTSQYKWLELNENVIVSGKGLREGRIITNSK
ncbi:MAG: hypothetical protein IJQ80_02640 [Clostridia bacterium]|nr:hypothetical protein [Clostridia bacterium]